MVIGKKRVHSRCMRLESLHDLLWMAWTTARLSNLHRIDCPCQCLPQTAAEITIGTNSSVAILCCFSASDSHASWNQWRFDTAPSPQLLEASDSNEVDGGLGAHVARNVTPFHCAPKECHQERSDLIPAERHIQTVWW